MSLKNRKLAEEKTRENADQRKENKAPGKSARQRKLVVEKNKEIKIEVQEDDVLEQASGQAIIEEILAKEDAKLELEKAEEQAIIEAILTNEFGDAKKEVLPSDIKEVLPSEVQADVSLDVKEVLPSEVQADVTLDVKEVLPSEVQADLFSDVKEDLSSEVQADVSSDVKEDLPSEVQVDVSSDVKEDLSSEVQADVSSDVKEDLSSEVQADVSLDVKEVLPSEVQEVLPSDVQEVLDAAKAEQNAKEEVVTPAETVEVPTIVITATNNLDLQESNTCMVPAMNGICEEGYNELGGCCVAIDLV